MAEPTEPCPKCGETLWFYRIWQEELLLDSEGSPVEILDITYTEWDLDEVACPSCNHKPRFRWEETELGHKIIILDA